MTGSATQRGSVNSTSVRRLVLAREGQPQQGRIGVAAGQPGGGIRPGGAHLHPPARPAAGEGGDDLLGGLVGGAGQESHPQHPVRPAGGDPGFPQRLVAAGQYGGQPVGECSASRREGHPRPGAGEQPHSELALQLLDLLGQRRLGHEQPFRRTGEIAFFGDGGEVAQQPSVDIHAIRLWTRVLDAGAGSRPGLIRKPR